MRVIARFRAKDDGHEFALLEQNGRLGLNGFQGEFMEIHDVILLKLLHQNVRDGRAQVIAGPTLYHCWHVCICPQCTGRFFDHSQGSFNDHLRFVANEHLLTFPAPQAESV